MQHTWPTVTPVNESSYFKAHSDRDFLKTKDKNWNNGMSKYLVQGRRKKKKQKPDLKEGFGAVIWLRFTLHTNKDKAACFLQMKVHRPLNFLPAEYVDQIKLTYTF